MMKGVIVVMLRRQLNRENSRDILMTNDKRFSIQIHITDDEILKVIQT